METVEIMVGPVAHVYRGLLGDLSFRAYPHREDWSMRKSLRFVGLDVHKETITVAVAEARGGPAEVVEVIPNDGVALYKVLDRLGPPRWLRVCYEAGPTGFGLARRLRAAGIDCLVAAPSLVPVQKGCRIKTDRRDARKLAQFLRSGDLVAVAIPDEETEAMRDLERARGDAKIAERAARQQLDKFLLRHERIWRDGTKWTQRHWRWIRQQEFVDVKLRSVRQDYETAVEQATARVERITADIAEFAETCSLAPRIKALQGLRGVDVVTAVVLAAEIGDFKRFGSPRNLMAFVGLVPSEHSSGASSRRGRITRTGNKHVRWLLTEAAWNYQFYPKASKRIKARRKLVSSEVRAIAEKAEQRLYRRFQRLLRKGKQPNRVVTAIARELCGFIWAIAREEKLLAA